VKEFIEVFTAATHGNEKEFNSGDNEVTLDELFRIFEYIRLHSKVSSRMGSLVMNLGDRKKSNWVVPEYRESGPKMISEIHNEYEKEREESEKIGN